MLVVRACQKLADGTSELERDGVWNAPGHRGCVRPCHPNTGAAVYDSIPYNGTRGWYQVGGTSLAAPLIAGVFALAGGVSGFQNPASLPYTTFTSINSHDVTTGTNGNCGTIMCTAGPG